MKTALCTLLGIELPIVQAPMGCSRPGPRCRRVQCRRTWHAGALARRRRHHAATDSRNACTDLSTLWGESRARFPSGRTACGLPRRARSDHFLLLARPVSFGAARKRGRRHRDAHGWIGRGCETRGRRWCWRHRSARMGGWGPRPRDGGNHAAGTGRSWRRFTRPRGGCERHCGRTGSCSGVSPRCGRRLDWHSITCQQRGRNSPSLSRTYSAGQWSRHNLSRQPVRRSSAECAASYA